MQRTDSLEKTLMLGGIGDRRRRGRQRMRWLASPAQRRSGVLPAAGKLLLSPPHASRPSPSHATLADSLIPRPVRDLSLRTGRGRGDDDPDGPWRLLRLEQQQLWRLFYPLLGKGGGERSRCLSEAPWEAP